MTGIRDQAEKAEEEVVLIGNAAPGTHRIEGEELVAAEEIGTDEFPQYGDYLPTVRHPEAEKTVYLECPPVLAKAIADQVAHNAGLEGRWFRLEEAEKEDGRWTVAVEVAEAGLKFAELPWR